MARIRINNKTAGHCCGGFLSVTLVLERSFDRARAYERIRADLVRCHIRAKAMGMPLVAEHLGAAIEELDRIEFVGGGAMTITAVN
jgi:hypothetical protein